MEMGLVAGQDDVEQSPPRRDGYYPAAGAPVGTTLIGLGRPAKAEGVLRESAGLCGSPLVPSHHRTLEAELVLGTALAAQDRHAGAVETLTATRTARPEHFGTAHPSTWRPSTAQPNTARPSSLAAAPGLAQRAGQQRQTG
ncbi:hypothetical protein [Kitasatospora sp. NPDC001175]|uniref:hypothetical protein n=1 Tax=Kitasatospora sp. NPDC001175 TaxID=3157103 RepID=UPI003D052B0D